LQSRSKLNLKPVWLIGIRILPAGNTNYLTDRTDPHVRFVFFPNLTIPSRRWQIDKGDEVCMSAARRPPSMLGARRRRRPELAGEDLQRGGAGRASPVDARRRRSSARRHRTRLPGRRSPEKVFSAPPSERGGVGRASPSGARRRRSSVRRRRMLRGQLLCVTSIRQSSFITHDNLLITVVS
jgi:hypothetical protein